MTYGLWKCVDSISREAMPTTKADTLKMSKDPVPGVVNVAGRTEHSSSLDSSEPP